MTHPTRYVGPAGGAASSATLATLADVAAVSLTVAESPTNSGLFVPAVGGGGGSAFRSISATAPDTTGWAVNDLWLDTSTES